MSALKDTLEIVSPHLDEFTKIFNNALKGNVPLLNTIAKYMARKKGKQIRPLFVYLAAGLNGEINKNTHVGAALIELLHTATLIHDDVVDEAWKRRGLLSLNAAWKNKVSVLMGDYILSRGLLLAIDNEAFGLLKIVSEATKEMSEGELLQIEKSRKLDITKEVYFEVIRKKTATLIAACCAIGAKSVGADKNTIELMYKFGEKVGIAFQIKDDLFDYDSKNLSGKNSGADLKEKKLTLAMIHTLEQCSFIEKAELLHIIKFHRKNPDKRKKLYNKVIEKEGIEYATSKMHQYRDEAIDILSGLPQTSFNNALQKLVRYTTDRKS